MEQNRKNILIIGGSGYIGSEIIKAFSGAYNFLNLSRTRLNQSASNNILCDVRNSIDFLNFSEPIDMVINCGEFVDCSREKLNGRCYAETVEKIVSFARKNNIPKIIHFSNHSEEGTYHNDYVHNKLLADRVIEHSGLEYIIFKPTVIFGHDSLFDAILGRFATLKVLPKNIAQQRFAPVFIGDVLRNVGYAVEHHECWNQCYVVCGPELMDVKEALDRYHVRTPSVVKVPKLISMIQLRRTFDRQVYNFYSRYMDPGSDAHQSEYPSLLKPLKFY
jgi:NADH dehydrogenase